MDARRGELRRFGTPAYRSFSRDKPLVTLALFSPQHLPAPRAQYFDNQVILDLCEGKPGLFPMLDDACQMGDATSEKLLHMYDQ